MAQHVFLIAGIVASFRLGSVWPFVIGTATALLVLPAIVIASSPVITVTPTQVTRAQRKRWLFIVGLLAVVVLTGLLS